MLVFLQNNKNKKMRLSPFTQRWLWLVPLTFSPAVISDDIQIYCENRPSDCLATVAERQHTLTNDTTAWWHLETLRLTSLFELKRFNELYAALRPWIHSSRVPTEYQPEVAMLFGKWLLVAQRNEESVRFFEEALNGFERLYATEPTQHTALKVLNVLTLLHRFDHARTFAMELVKKGDNDPIFYREIFAELGHIAHQQDKKVEHIEHRRQSVHWAKQVPDDQQTSLAYNNYAVALLKNGDYQQARRAFVHALGYAEKAMDRVEINNISVRLAQVAYQQQKLDDALRYLDTVDIDWLHPVKIGLFRELSMKVSKAKGKLQVSD